jgi:hypothetical protein
MPIVPPATEPAVEERQLTPSTEKHVDLRPPENVEVAPPPCVRTPVFDTEKSVVVALAVDDAMIKRFVFVSPRFAEMENFAHGLDVPMPTLPLMTGDDEVEVSEPE